MPQLRIAAVLALAIILQLSLRAVWAPLVFIDFPLVVVVYIALQREAWQALIAGTIAGLAVDAASGGVISAGGRFRRGGLRRITSPTGSAPPGSFCANNIL